MIASLYHRGSSCSIFVILSGPRAASRSRDNGERLPLYFERQAASGSTLIRLRQLAEFIPIRAGDLRLGRAPAPVAARSAGHVHPRLGALPEKVLRRR